MKPLYIFILLILTLPAFSFAQILPGQDCYNVVLQDADKSYWVRRGFGVYYGNFLELDGGSTPTPIFGLENLISDFRKGPTVQAAFGNDYDPGVVLCPEGQERSCGSKTCVDISIAPNPTPLYRLTATDFTSGDEVTFHLSGYAIAPTTFTEKFELSDISNDQISQKFVSLGGKELFRLGLVGDESGDKAISLIFFPMSIYNQEFAIKLDQSKITGELEQGIVSPELQKKIEKIKTVESQLNTANIDPEKRKEIQSKLDEVKKDVQTQSRETVEAKLDGLVNEIAPAPPTEPPSEPPTGPPGTVPPGEKPPEEKPPVEPEQPLDCSTIKQCLAGTGRKFSSKLFD